MVSRVTAPGSDETKNENTPSSLPESGQTAAPSGVGEDGRQASSERVSPKSPTEKIAAEEAPKRPERRKKKRREHPVLAFVNGMMTLVLLMVAAVVAGFYVLNREFTAPGVMAENRVIFSAPGTSLATISGELEDMGAVRDGWIFNLGVRLNRKAGQVKAGEYEIAAASSMRAIMEQLVEGKSIVHRVTLPEGLTSEQIVERLRDDPVLVGEITDIPAEGSLMPDTYTFTRGQTRAAIINQLKRAQERALAEIWANRDPSIPLTTPQELVILASIVEKETGVAYERPKVAGVFVNRLRKNMRLQSDPTIIYGLVGGKGTLGRGILRSEIQSDTPYNTYVIDGLPIGPIANPGRAALEATARPASHDYVFFVADGTGGHAFAKTLDEHNRNVARWREIEAQRSQAQPQTNTN